MCRAAHRMQLQHVRCKALRAELYRTFLPLPLATTLTGSSSLDSSSDDSTGGGACGRLILYQT